MSDLISERDAFIASLDAMTPQQDPLAPGQQAGAGVGGGTLQLDIGQALAHGIAPGHTVSSVEYNKALRALAGLRAGDENGQIQAMLQADPNLAALVRNMESVRSQVALHQYNRQLGAGSKSARLDSQHYADLFLRAQMGDQRMYESINAYVGQPVVDPFAPSAAAPGTQGSGLIESGLDVVSGAASTAGGALRSGLDAVGAAVETGVASAADTFEGTTDQPDSALSATLQNFAQGAGEAVGHLFTQMEQDIDEKGVHGALGEALGGAATAIGPRLAASLMRSPAAIYEAFTGETIAPGGALSTVNEWADAIDAGTDSIEERFGIDGTGFSALGRTLAETYTYVLNPIRGGAKVAARFGPGMSNFLKNATKEKAKKPDTKPGYLRSLPRRIATTGTSLGALSIFSNEWDALKKHNAQNPNDQYTHDEMVYLSTGPVAIMSVFEAIGIERIARIVQFPGTRNILKRAASGDAVGSFSKLAYIAREAAVTGVVEVTTETLEEVGNIMLEAGVLDDKTIVDTFKENMLGSYRNQTVPMAFLVGALLGGGGGALGLRRARKFSQENAAAVQKQVDEALASQTEPDAPGAYDRDAILDDTEDAAVGEEPAQAAEEPAQTAAPPADPDTPAVVVDPEQGEAPATAAASLGDPEDQIVRDVRGDIDFITGEDGQIYEMPAEGYQIESAGTTGLDEMVDIDGLVGTKQSLETLSDEQRGENDVHLKSAAQIHPLLSSLLPNNGERREGFRREGLAGLSIVMSQQPDVAADINQAIGLARAGEVDQAQTLLVSAIAKIKKPDVIASQQDSSVNKAFDVILRRAELARGTEGNEAGSNATNRLRAQLERYSSGGSGAQVDIPAQRPVPQSQINENPPPGVPGETTAPEGAPTQGGTTNQTMLEEYQGTLRNNMNAGLLASLVGRNVTSAEAVNEVASKKSLGARHKKARAVQSILRGDLDLNQFAEAFWGVKNYVPEDTVAEDVAEAIVNGVRSGRVSRDPASFFHELATQGQRSPMARDFRRNVRAARDKRLAEQATSTDVEGTSLAALKNDIAETIFRKTGVARNSTVDKFIDSLVDKALNGVPVQEVLNNKKAGFGAFAKRLNRTVRNEITARDTPQLVDKIKEFAGTNQRRINNIDLQHQQFVDLFREVFNDIAKSAGVGKLPDPSQMRMEDMMRLVEEALGFNVEDQPSFFEAFMTSYRRMRMKPRHQAEHVERYYQAMHDTLDLAPNARRHGFTPGRAGGSKGKWWAVHNRKAAAWQQLAIRWRLAPTLNWARAFFADISRATNRVTGVTPGLPTIGRTGSKFQGEIVESVRALFKDYEIYGQLDPQDPQSLGRSLADIIANRVRAASEVKVGGKYISAAERAAALGDLARQRIAAGEKDVSFTDEELFGDDDTTGTSTALDGGYKRMLQHLMVALNSPIGYEIPTINVATREDRAVVREGIRNLVNAAIARNREIYYESTIGSDPDGSLRKELKQTYERLEAEAMDKFRDTIGSKKATDSYKIVKALKGDGNLESLTRGRVAPDDAQGGITRQLLSAIQSAFPNNPNATATSVLREFLGQEGFMPGASNRYALIRQDSRALDRMLRDHLEAYQADPTVISTWSPEMIIAVEMFTGGTIDFTLLLGVDAGANNRVGRAIDRITSLRKELQSAQGSGSEFDIFRRYMKAASTLMYEMAYQFASNGQMKSRLRNGLAENRQALRLSTGRRKHHIPNWWMAKMRDRSTGESPDVSFANDVILNAIAGDWARRDAKQTDDYIEQRLQDPIIQDQVVQHLGVLINPQASATEKNISKQWLQTFTHEGSDIAKYYDLIGMQKSVEGFSKASLDARVKDTIGSIARAARPIGTDGFVPHNEVLRGNRAFALAVGMAQGYASSVPEGGVGLDPDLDAYMRILASGRTIEQFSNDVLRDKGARGLVEIIAVRMQEELTGTAYTFTSAMMLRNIAHRMPDSPAAKAVNFNDTLGALRQFEEETTAVSGSITDTLADQLAQFKQAMASVIRGVEESGGISEEINNPETRELIYNRIRLRGRTTQATQDASQQQLDQLDSQMEGLVESVESLLALDDHIYRIIGVLSANPRNADYTAALDALVAARTALSQHNGAAVRFMRYMHHRDIGEQAVRDFDALSQDEQIQLPDSVEHLQMILSNRLGTHKAFVEQILELQQSYIGTEVPRTKSGDVDIDKISAMASDERTGVIGRLALEQFLDGTVSLRASPAFQQALHTYTLSELTGGDANRALRVYQILGLNHLDGNNSELFKSLHLAHTVVQSRQKGAANAGTFALAEWMKKFGVGFSEVMTEAEQLGETRLGRNRMKSLAAQQVDGMHFRSVDDLISNIARLIGPHAGLELGMPPDSNPQGTEISSALKSGFLRTKRAEGVRGIAYDIREPAGQQALAMDMLNYAMLQGLTGRRAVNKVLLHTFFETDGDGSRLSRAKRQRTAVKRAGILGRENDGVLPEKFTKSNDQFILKMYAAIEGNNETAFVSLFREPLQKRARSLFKVHSRMLLAERQTQATEAASREITAALETRRLTQIRNSRSNGALDYSQNEVISTFDVLADLIAHALGNNSVSKYVDVQRFRNFPTSVDPDGRVLDLTNKKDRKELSQLMRSLERKLEIAEIKGRASTDLDSREIKDAKIQLANIKSGLSHVMADMLVNADITGPGIGKSMSQLASDRIIDYFREYGKLNLTDMVGKGGSERLNAVSRASAEVDALLALSEAITSSGDGTGRDQGLSISTAINGADLTKSKQIQQAQTNLRNAQKSVKSVRAYSQQWNIVRSKQRVVFRIMEEGRTLDAPDVISIQGAWTITELLAFLSARRREGRLNEITFVLDPSQSLPPLDMITGGYSDQVSELNRAINGGNLDQLVRSRQADSLKTLASLGTRFGEGERGRDRFMEAAADFLRSFNAGQLGTVSGEVASVGGRRARSTVLLENTGAGAQFMIQEAGSNEARVYGAGGATSQKVAAPDTPPPPPTAVSVSTDANQSGSFIIPEGADVSDLIDRVRGAGEAAADPEIAEAWQKAVADNLDNLRAALSGVEQYRSNLQSEQAKTSTDNLVSALRDTLVYAATVYDIQVSASPAGILDIQRQLNSQFRPNRIIPLPDGLGDVAQYVIAALNNDRGAMAVTAQTLGLSSDDITSIQRAIDVEYSDIDRGPPGNPSAASARTTLPGPDQTISSTTSDPTSRASLASVANPIPLESDDAAVNRVLFEIGQQDEILRRAIQNSGVVTVVAGPTSNAPGLRRALDGLTRQERESPLLQGVTTEDGHVYLLAKQIQPGAAWPVLLHEFGVHHGLEAMIGRNNIAKLAKDISERADRGDRTASIAMARLRSAAESNAELADGRTRAAQQETVAYYVETAAGQGVTGQGGSILERLGRWFKNFLHSLFGRTPPMSERDIVALALSAARRAATAGAVRSVPQPVSAFAAIAEDGVINMGDRDVDVTEEGDTRRHVQEVQREVEAQRRKIKSRKPVQAAEQAVNKADSAKRKLTKLSDIKNDKSNRLLTNYDARMSAWVDSLHSARRLFRDVGRVAGDKYGLMPENVDFVSRAILATDSHAAVEEQMQNRYLPQIKSAVASIKQASASAGLKMSEQDIEDSVNTYLEAFNAKELNRAFALFQSEWPSSWALRRKAVLKDWAQGSVNDSQAHEAVLELFTKMRAEMKASGSWSRWFGPVRSRGSRIDQEILNDILGEGGKDASAFVKVNRQYLTQVLNVAKEVSDDSIRQLVRVGHPNGRLLRLYGMRTYLGSSFRSRRHVDPRSEQAKMLAPDGQVSTVFNFDSPNSVFAVQDKGLTGIGIDMLIQSNLASSQARVESEIAEAMANFATQYRSRPDVKSILDLRIVDDQPMYRINEKGRIELNRPTGVDSRHQFVHYADGRARTIGFFGSNAVDTYAAVLGTLRQSHPGNRHNPTGLKSAMYWLVRFRAVWMTRYNPFFWGKAGIRDTQQYAAQLSADFGPGMGASFLGRMAASVGGASGARIPIAGLAKEIVRVGRGEAPRSDLGIAYKELLESGGVTTQTLLFSQAGREHVYDNVLEQRGRPEFTTTFNSFSQAVEMLPRIVAYNTLKEHGVPIVQAQAVAKNLMNFSQSGTALKPGDWPTVFFLFFRPGLIGSFRLLESFQNLSPAGKVVAPTVIIWAGFMMAMLAHGMVDDEEEAQEWLGQDPKRMMFGLRIPGAHIGDDRGLELPFALGVGYFLGLGQVLYKSYTTGDFSLFGESAFTAPVISRHLLPIDIDGSASGMLYAVVPDAIEPVVRLANNQNGFGSNLKRVKDGVADAYTLKPNTPQVYNEVAGWLSEISGGQVDINPNEIREITGFIPPLRTIVDYGDWDGFDWGTLLMDVGGRLAGVSGSERDYWHGRYAAAKAEYEATKADTEALSQKYWQSPEGTERMRHFKRTEQVMDAAESRIRKARKALNGYLDTVGPKGEEPDEDRLETLQNTVTEAKRSAVMAVKGLTPEDGMFRGGRPSPNLLQ